MIHELASIVIFLFVLLVYAEVRKWRIKKKLQHFESPKEVPILGVANRFVGQSNDKFVDILFGLFEEVRSSPIQLWLGPVLIVGISEPEDIQILLTSDDCLDRPYFYEFFHCKSGITVTSKEEWKPDRRALNTAFNVRTLQSYVPSLNNKSRILIKNMKQYLNKRSDLYRTIFIGLIDMITKTTMGCEMDMQSERGALFYGIVKTIMNNVQYRSTRIWLRWDFMYFLTKVSRDERIPLETGQQFMRDLCTKRKNDLEHLKAQGVDYLENARKDNTANVMDKCLMLEQDGIFSNEKVIDHISLIILAGIDTSSITVFATLLMLAIHQKHQELVLDELRSIFDTADCDVTAAELTKMKCTERVIKETLRLFPSVPFIGRKPSADIQLSKGIIPKGTIVVVNIIHMHRNPKFWGPNANEFDPDRFLPENVATRPPMSYIPFSAGPRNCIGLKYAMLSAKITLAHLLRRYKFTTDLRMEYIRMNTHLVLEIINDQPLRIEERSF